MKKSLLTLLPVMLMLFGFNTQAVADDTYTDYYGVVWQKVTTCDGFIAAMKKNLNIKVLADIDLSNFKNTIDKFTGRIDGMEDDVVDGKVIFHTLSNCKHIIAFEMEGATVSNIYLKNCKPDWPSYVNSSAKGDAVLCREANNCTFMGIIVSDANVCRDGSVADFLDMKVIPTNRNAAGLVAQAKNSKFIGISLQGCNIYANDDYAGGVVAQADGCTFNQIYLDTNCSIHAQGNAIYTSGDAGGVAGKATNSTFTNCTSCAKVSSPLDNVGGIAGSTDNGCKFLRCENRGYLAHLSFSKAKDFSSYATASAAVTAGSSSVMSAINSYTSYFDQLAEWNTKFASVEHNLADIKTKYGLHSWESINYSEDYYIPVRDSQPKEPTEYNTSAYCALAFQVVMTAVQIAQTIYEEQDNDDIGGIVGRMEGGGTIEACANYGIIRTMDAFSGGIAGEAEGNGLVITCCQNSGVVSGYEQTGGIVGKIHNGTISYCLNTGNVSKAGHSDSNTFGRIYGEKGSGVTSIGNCYSGNMTEPEGKDQRMVSQQMLASGQLGMYLNEQSDTTYWRQTVGEDMYPSLRETSDSLMASSIKANADTVYHVNDVLNLLAAMSNQYANIELDEDIDVNSTNIFNLSSRYMPFHGSINGNGYKISNVAYAIQAQKDKTFGNDNREGWTSLFPAAENATFKNLTLDNFSIDYSNGQAWKTAMLVSQSSNCRYENVHLTNSNFNHNGKYFGYNMGGLVSDSYKDTFVDCAIDETCDLTATGTRTEDAILGGIAATSNQSTFIRCHNAGKVRVLDVEKFLSFNSIADLAGGLVGTDNGSTFKGCMNSGYVFGDEYIGGLVGKGSNSKFVNCVNLGTVEGDDGGEDAVGGFAGWLKNSSIDNSYSFGNVNHSSSDINRGTFVGETEGSFNLSETCKSQNNRIKDFTEDELTDVNSGKYAYDMNAAADSTIWYQAIDDNYNYITKYFVPIPDAGVIYQNYLCDGTNSLTYSNKYNGLPDHTKNASQTGICRDCGFLADDPEDGLVIDIANATDLIDFAKLVSHSSKYSTISARLMNDIDLTNCDYPMIGSKEATYKGTFNGRGHRIKNMNLVGEEGKACGFFAYVGNGAVIDSLVIDSTCCITGSGTDVAGIVGSEWGDSKYAKCDVVIRHCANEANITGSLRVAGILGRIDNDDVATVTITNCYNSGDITGTSTSGTNNSAESAAICGWIWNNFTVSNCYNTGKVTGYQNTGSLFFRYQSASTNKSSNNYDLNGTQSGVTQISSTQVSSGELCYLVNGKTDAATNGFYQNIYVDGSYPNFDVDEDDIVKKYGGSNCAGKEMAIYYTSRHTNDLEAAQHKYDDNGFCTQAAGETHYQEPDKIGNTYQIKNVGNLYWVAQQVNTGMDYPNCKLVNDIVDNESVFVEGTYGETLNTKPLRSWTPIGNNKYAYQNATFDGNGHTISGLYCDSTDVVGIGLFGNAYNGAVIKNVGIKRSYFDGDLGVGAIVGWGAQPIDLNGSEDDINTIMCSGNGPSIINCFVDGHSKIHGSFAGGIAGFYTGNSEIKNKFNTCYSLANISGDGSSSLCGSIYMHETEQPYSGKLPYCYEYHNGGCTNVYGTEIPADSITNYLMKGKLCYLMNQSEYIADGGIKWAQDLGGDDDELLCPGFGTENVRLTRKINKKWGTVIVPYTLKSDTATVYFTISALNHEEGSNVAIITLKEATEVPANTPCIFYNNNDSCVVFKSNGGEVILPEKEHVTKDTLDVTMHGMFFGGTVPTDGFINSDSVFWCKSYIVNEYTKKSPAVTVDNVDVPAYCAYLVLDDLEGIDYIYFSIDGAGYDFNQDGVVDSKDVTFLANILSGKTPTDYIYDVDDDRMLNISDISVLIKELKNPTASTNVAIPTVTKTTNIDGKEIVTVYGK